MPISEVHLREASRRFKPADALLHETARSRGLKTVFLCHSHADRDLAQGLITLLREAGWNAYVDWNDTAMPDRPNRETADRIRKKILDLNYFLFLASPRSMASRWCPWELGCATGTKAHDSIIVCPTTSGTTTHGSEYIDLHRRIDFSSLKGLSVWHAGRSTGELLVATL